MKSCQNHAVLEMDVNSIECGLFSFKLINKKLKNLKKRNLLIFQQKQMWRPIPILNKLQGLYQSRST